MGVTLDRSWNDNNDLFVNVEGKKYVTKRFFFSSSLLSRVLTRKTTVLPLTGPKRREPTAHPGPVV